MAETGEAPKQYTSWVNKIKKPVISFLTAMTFYNSNVNINNAYAPEVKHKISTELNKDHNKKFFDMQGVKIYFNDKNEISEYTDQEGNTYEYSKEAIDTVKKQAKETGEPVELDIIPVIVNYIPKDETNFFTPEERKQKINECVSPEELEKRNIHIHNSDVKLFIRPSAFKEGGILEKFKLGNKNSMDIYVGGPASSKFYFPEVPDSIAEKCFFDYYKLQIQKDGKWHTQTIDEIRQRKLDEVTEYLSYIYNDKNKDKYKDKESINFFAEAKMRQHLYSDKTLLSDKDLIDITVSKNLEEYSKESNDRAVGRFIPLNDGSDIILICTGKADVKQYLGYYAKPDGSMGIVGIKTDLGNFKWDLMDRDYRIKETDNYPSKDNYSEEYAPEGYKYGGQSAELIFHHELWHKKEEDKITTEKDHEWKTDERAVEGIQKAYEYWVDSGYKDDSKYPFIFMNSDGKITVSQVSPDKADSPTVAV